MMRDLLRKKPMLGWIVAAMLMLITAYTMWRNLGTNEASRLGENVTIRCQETGDTWAMPRGLVEKNLYERPFPIDPNIGIVNPKTGKPTGFPVDDWKSTIDRINAERKAVRDKNYATQ